MTKKIRKIRKAGGKELKRLAKRRGAGEHRRKISLNSPYVEYIILELSLSHNTSLTLTSGKMEFRTTTSFRNQLTCDINFQQEHLLLKKKKKRKKRVNSFDPVVQCTLKDDLYNNTYIL